MKKIIFLILTLALPLSALAINITVPQSTAFGNVLRGNANGTYSPVATSTLFSSLVSSVTNTDGSLTISPTTGDVVANINYSKASVWMANQTINDSYKQIFGDGTGYQGQIYRGATDFIISSNLNPSGSQNDGLRMLLNGGDGNGTNKAGGSIRLTGGASTGSGQKAIVAIGAGSPTSMSRSPNSLFITQDLEIGNNLYLPLLDYPNELLKANGYMVTSAVAGTDYVASASVTSPITNTGTAANPNIGFDFSTNNVWTGTNKINKSSASAFIVENTGVNNNVLAVDTTIPGVGINSAPTSGQSLAVSGTSNQYAVNITRALSSGSTQRELAIFPTYTSTSNSSSGLYPLVVSPTDSRTIASVAGDTFVALSLSASRGSFSAASGSGTYRAFIGSASDSGTYNRTNGNQTINYGGFSTVLTPSPTHNDGGNNRTLTYNATGNSITWAGTPVESNAGSTLNLNYKTFESTGTVSSAGTLAKFSAFYNNATGGTSNNAYVFHNDTTLPNFLGGDGSKTYFGTGTNTLGSQTQAIGDASISYDGTDFNFNPKEIGTGKMRVLGTLQADTISATSTLATAATSTIATDFAFSGSARNYFVKVGANNSTGTTTLSGGTATVNNTLTRADSLILLTAQTCSNCGALSVGTITAGTSFVINSTNASDGSVVAWEIKQPIY